MDGGTCRWVLMVVFKQDRGSNCRRAAQLTFPEISLAACANSNSSDLAAYHSETGPSPATLTSPYLSSGAPNDTASATPGCASSAPSTCGRSRRQGATLRMALRWPPEWAA